MEKVYNIEGVKCGGCAAVVKEKLSNLEGVENVEVDVAKKKLIVVGTTNKEVLQKALSDTKFKID